MCEQEAAEKIDFSTLFSAFLRKRYSRRSRPQGRQGGKAMGNRGARAGFGKKVSKVSKKCQKVSKKVEK